ncbi:MAG: 2-hydroxyacyl-CoA dehydratase [Candidatus Latescibacteria bacterium]|nr:2-hydroxyacyl-CoA dehydratase [Candidatus Latescibacterota bacterium]
MKRIGITTTVPSEVILASGAVPVDINNVFINSKQRSEYIKAAERDGYPRNVCGWIKGLYGVLACESDIKTVIAVTQGDCSNTHALMETLQLIGIRTIPFAYPYNRGPQSLLREIAFLADELGTDIESAEKIRDELEPIRRQLDRLDEMTWKENRINGCENHKWLVSSSDFNSDYNTFAIELSDFLSGAEKRPPFSESLRLAYIGVPPILDDLHVVTEEFDARIVFNEVQRQFSMPVRGNGLVGQYLAYTYPYSIFHRLEYIIPELKRRRIHGVIHYVQSFCHRHIEDLVIRKKLDVPVLTIEGEVPGKVDARTKIRIQAFIEMLQE